jgi:putative Holliday junction resolvase
MGTGRALAVDLGTKRVGLAISDASGTLARPFKTLHATGGSALDLVVAEADTLSRDADGLTVIVVGVPAHLDGQASDQTQRAYAFIDQLRLRVHVPVVGEDERLTSREAEERLALQERDWRKRKAQLDAAAAAVFLQDFLDRNSSVLKIED